MIRWPGLVGGLGGALWIVRAAQGDDWLGVYVVCVASFLGVVWAPWKRNGPALGLGFVFFDAAATLPERGILRLPTGEAA